MITKFEDFQKHLSEGKKEDYCDKCDSTPCKCSVDESLKCPTCGADNSGDTKCKCISKP